METLALINVFYMKTLQSVCGVRVMCVNQGKYSTITLQRHNRLVPPNTVKVTDKSRSEQSLWWLNLASRKLDVTKMIFTVRNVVAAR